VSHAALARSAVKGLAEESQFDPYDQHQLDRQRPQQLDAQTTRSAARSPVNE
jgi:hypothetical protein